MDIVATGRERHESEESIAQRSQRPQREMGLVANRTGDWELNSPQKFKGQRFSSPFTGSANSIAALRATLSRTRAVLAQQTLSTNFSSPTNPNPPLWPL